MSKTKVLAACVCRLRTMKAELETLSAKDQESDRRALATAIVELEQLVRMQIRESIVSLRERNVASIIDADEKRNER